MTHEEVIRWFRRFRHDPLYRDKNGSRTVPINLLADFAGVPRQNLYAILNQDINLTPATEVRLSAAIRAVNAGLRWKRIDRTFYMNDPRFEEMRPVYDPSRHRREAPQRGGLDAD